MAGCLIGYRNWVAESGVSLAADSALANLPVTNLANSVVAKVYRSSGSTTPTIDIDLVTNRSVRMLGLFGINLGAADTIRHKLSATGVGNSELLDSGATATGTISGYDQYVYVLSAAVSARYWRIVVSAPSLSSDPGYVEIGLAGAFLGFEPGINYDFGSAESWEDMSRVTEAERSGAEYVDIGPRRREVSFTLGNMDTTDLAAARELDRIAGLTGQILFTPDSASADIQREAIFGRMRRVTPITLPRINNIYSKAFTIRESR